MDKSSRTCCISQGYNDIGINGCTECQLVIKPRTLSDLWFYDVVVLQVTVTEWRVQQLYWIISLQYTYISICLLKYWMSQKQAHKFSLTFDLHNICFICLSLFIYIYINIICPRSSNRRYILSDLPEGQDFFYSIRQSSFSIFSIFSILSVYYHVKLSIYYKTPSFFWNPFLFFSLLYLIPLSKFLTF